MAKIPIQVGNKALEKKEEDLIIGIDLGTTNSLICYIDEQGAPQVIGHPSHGQVIPSVIYFDDDDQPTVGEAARRMASERPARTIFSVKRLMGKSYEDEEVQRAGLAYDLHSTQEDDLVRVKIGDAYHTPIGLSALILGELKSLAESQLSRPVSKVVITVPAYFDDAQRQATKDAGRLAGLDVLRIVNEPTAASLAYGYLPDSAPKKIAVYDLGGGTFDLSILEVSGGIFDVLATHGDTSLGGDDIDMAIVQWMMDEYHITDRPELRWHARDLKHQLTTSDTATLDVQGANVTLSSTKLAELIKPLIDRTLRLFHDSLKDAELTTQDLDDVILVGGSTRMPIIRSAVEDYTGQTPNTDINPDTAIAMGAAIQADILAGRRQDLLLLDITPLSLGIETIGGLMDVLLPRNAKIPSAVKRSYTTSVDGQVSLKVAVYQGERDLVEHNRKLGEFILRDIPPMPAGIPKIEISFIIDTDGILQVKAQELRSGQQQHIQIKPSYGLAEEEMAKMLMDSIQHAESDMHVRALKEAQNEAQQLVKATDKFLDQNASWLTVEQVDDIKMRAHRLAQTIEGEEKDAILAATDELNTYTRPLAEIAMDRQIQASLAGQQADDLL